MFEKLLAGQLEKYLGDFVTNLKKEDLHLSAWSGWHRYVAG